MAIEQLIIGIFCGLCTSFPVKKSAATEINPPRAIVSQFRFLEAYYLNNSIVIPFDLVGRLILVRASAKGQEGNFIFDTGAEKLVLNLVHFEKGEREDYRSLGGGITGGTQAGRETILKRFDWDLLAFEEIRADLIDLSHIERKKNTKLLGLIGQELIEDLEVFIDYEEKLIILSRLNEQGNLIEVNDYIGSPIDSLEIKVRDNVILVKGKIDKYKVLFSLDSGAELNVLDRKVKRRILDHFKISKRVELSGTGQSTIEVLAGKLYKV